MVSAKSKTKKSTETPLELSEALVLVARKHFALHGFQGASLKDIAHEAGVANSLINYHFTDKEGLFRACTERLASTQMATINRILSEPRSREELRVRLELFVEEMSASVLADPYGFEMLDREMRSGNEMVLKLFQETLLHSFHEVVKFFKQAGQNGLLKDGFEPLLLASFLFTLTCETSRKDFLAKKFFNMSMQDPAWRKKLAHHVVSLFLNGVVK